MAIYEEIKKQRFYYCSLLNNAIKEVKAMVG